MKNDVSNSADSANQTPNTGKGSNIPARARANLKFDAKTISEVARFCAKQLTESEACRLLNVRPQSWFSWKSRHNRAEKFADLLEAFRADRIDSLIAKIEKSADGVGLKQPDWRAAAHLLSIADARRFSDSAQRASIDISVSTAPPDREVINRALAIFMQGLKDKVQHPVVDVPVETVKQLTSGPQDAPGKEVKE
jgi:hypothetical protein